MAGKSRKRNKKATDIPDVDLNKTNTLLGDFEMEFLTRLAKFDDKLQKELRSIDWAFEVLKKKISPNVLYSKVQWNQKKEEPVKNSQKGMKGKQPRQSRQRTNSMDSSVVLSESTTRKTRSSSLNTRVQNVNNILTATKFKTPVYQTTSVPNLITPKIKSNAPLSIVRHPKQGEIAWSQSGSPLLVSALDQNNRPNVNVPLSDGRVVSILPENRLRLYDIPNLDEETRQELIILREHIDTFINTA